jgi:hypothetical protein
VLLADAVWTWEDAQALGAPEFGRVLARTDRGRRNGSRNGNGNGAGQGGYGREAVAVGPGVESVARTRVIPLVSPLRGVELSGTLEVRIGSQRPAQQVDRPAAAAVPVLAATPTLAPDDDEPPFPEEAVAVLAAAEQAATMPREASAGQVLHVRFQGTNQDAVVAAFQELRGIIHERPGETSVVLYIPAGSGRVQRMELRVGVAYDAELAALIERRVGPGMVDLRLAEA